MAANMEGVLTESLREKVNSSKVLVVGAGGIGCELLKNLVLSGFRNIEVIDLDTIDVSNLNRQFLFHKEHVGKSKSQVAKESALKFNPDVTIKAHHGSIMVPEYGTEYFKGFDVVMNALDNRAARNHVNRMCLAAEVPLIESGTSGYLGQVTVIKRGLTECYECQPQPAQKSFPGCTIRNTPSEPVHCVVWAKHLFNQLFGEEDPDQDVSPDTEDPEATADAGQRALETEANQNTAGGIERKSTRLWAMDTGYDAVKLFNKLFRDDIKYLLSMENLWKKRRRPMALDYTCLPETASVSGAGGIRDQRVWSIQECANCFKDSLESLKEQFLKLGAGAMLVWDKDDDPALNFVTSTANIRAYIFGIPLKSRFDIKSIAGNIIPAIATTNAIIGGLLVMEGLKILEGNIDKCKSIFLNRQPNPRKKLLVPCMLDKPNPKCYVCSKKPEATVKVNVKSLTVKTFEEKILKGQFGMVAPDVEIDDGKGTIIISSEEGETEDNANKTLSEFGIISGSRLVCDDFLQEFNIIITVRHAEELEEDKEFEVIGDISEVLASAKPASNGKANGSVEAPEKEEQDDLMIVDEEASIPGPSSRKRKVSDDDDTPVTKKIKTSAGDDIIVTDEDSVVVL